MDTVYSELHLKHNPEGELSGGKMVPPFESPQRVKFVLDRIASTKLGPICEPKCFDDSEILRVHDTNYINFLKTGWQQWADSGFKHQMLPTVWPARRHQQRIPDNIDGQIGYYAHSVETGIVAGTWQAAKSSSDVALTAAHLIQVGASSAFGLCRPPGHHACTDMYGGYCFINNAAVAAQHLLDSGAKRIAILDPDFHHGNGTQDIFYQRNDVYYLSLHGEPQNAYPYFMGYSDETGELEGEGFNTNYPMPRNTPFSVWREALGDALKKIDSYRPDVLIVSLGVDTFEHDPISFFKLTSDDFRTYGSMMGALKLPTLFLLEGGYAVEDVGINVVNVLSGFEDH